MRLNLSHCWLLVAMSFLVCIGCDSAANVELAPIERAELMLTKVPVGSTTIGSAQENLSDDSKIVVKGWADLKFYDDGEDKARFLVREILDDHDHGGEGHDPSSCVFCRRRMNAAPKAAVVFVDENGKLLPYRIDKLFPVKQGDEVIVTGTGTLDEGLDLFKITASGMFLPK